MKFLSLFLVLMTSKQVFASSSFCSLLLAKRNIEFVVVDYSFYSEQFYNNLVNVIDKADGFFGNHEIPGSLQIKLSQTDDHGTNFIPFSTINLYLNSFHDISQIPVALVHEYAHAVLDLYYIKKIPGYYQFILSSHEFDRMRSEEKSFGRTQENDEPLPSEIFFDQFLRPYELHEHFLDKYSELFADLIPVVVTHNPSAAAIASKSDSRDFFKVSPVRNEELLFSIPYYALNKTRYFLWENHLSKGEAHIKNNEIVPVVMEEIVHSFLKNAPNGFLSPVNAFDKENFTTLNQNFINRLKQRLKD